MKKDLYVLVAHIDDIELSCWGYINKHANDYDNINLIIASDWERKDKIWRGNIESMSSHLKNKEFNYINLKFPQRKLQTNLDDLKDKFYGIINFDQRFDILTHDDKDCHTDHLAINMIAMGMYKYTNKFITIYSPSSSKFKTNYWIPLDKDAWDIKVKMCNKYNIQAEQSYTKLGYYLQSEEHYNIGKTYQMENFVHNDYEHYDVYRILKWL